MPNVKLADYTLEMNMLQIYRPAYRMTHIIILPITYQHVTDHYRPTAFQRKSVSYLLFNS